MQNPQQTEFSFETITLDSQFDSGNMCEAKSISPFKVHYKYCNESLSLRLHLMPSRLLTKKPTKAGFTFERLISSSTPSTRLQSQIFKDRINNLIKVKI